MLFHAFQAMWHLAYFVLLIRSGSGCFSRHQGPMTEFVALHVCTMPLCFALPVVFALLACVPQSLNPRAADNHGVMLRLLACETRRQLFRGHERATCLCCDLVGLD